MPNSDHIRFVSALAEKYGQRLKRFMMAHTRNPADVPDLVQEVFLRLMRVDSHESVRSPEAYLFTVARHVVQQHTLRQSATPVSVDISSVFAEMQLISEEEPAERVDSQHQFEKLERTFAQMPKHYLAALIMHRYAGFSIEEIGAQLGVARVTAKKYLARALLTCREARRAQE